MQRPLWRKLVEAGTRIVLPDVCAGCGIAGSWICDNCYEEVRPVDSSTCCRLCGSPATSERDTCGRCQEWPPLDFQVRSAFEFSGPVRQSILRMKYQGEYARARWHGGHLVEVFRETGWDIDVIVPVPLHRKRMRSRGYNQSEKLARHIGERLELDVVNCLSRERDTPSQTTLSRDQRSANVAGAFACSPYVEGLNVMIVDDVLTTGATLLECVYACDLAGASSVRGLTVATDV